MKQGTETASFKQVMDTIREISESVARVDERTAHILKQIEDMDRDFESLRKAAAARQAELDSRVDSLNQEMAVVRRLVNIIWSILATVGAGIVTLGVWFLKSGVR